MARGVGDGREDLPQFDEIFLTQRGMAIKAVDERPWAGGRHDLKDARAASIPLTLHAVVMPALLLHHPGRVPPPDTHTLNFEQTLSLEGPPQSNDNLSVIRSRHFARKRQVRDPSLHERKLPTGYDSQPIQLNVTAE